MNKLYLGISGVFEDTQAIYNSFVKSYSLGTIEAKTNTVTVPLMDGKLDLTDVFGEVRYNSRKIKFPMLINSNTPQTDYINLVSKYAGKRIQIKLSESDTYCFVGRCEISALETSGSGWVFDIEVEAEPYRTKTTATTVSKTVSGSLNVSLSNAGKTVIPYVTTTAAISIVQGSNVFAFSAGTNMRNVNFKLTKGTNAITINGTATVTLSYTEAIL